MNYQKQWLQRSSVGFFSNFATDSFYLALPWRFYNMLVRNFRTQPKIYGHLHQYINTSRKPPAGKNNYANKRDHEKYFSILVRNW